MQNKRMEKKVTKYNFPARFRNGRMCALIQIEGTLFRSFLRNEVYSFHWAKSYLQYICSEQKALCKTKFTFAISFHCFFLSPANYLCKFCLAGFSLCSPPSALLCSTFFHYLYGRTHYFPLQQFTFVSCYT